MIDLNTNIVVIFKLNYIAVGKRLVDDKEACEEDELCEFVNEKACNKEQVRSRCPKLCKNCGNDSGSTKVKYLPLKSCLL